MAGLGRDDESLFATVGPGLEATLEGECGALLLRDCTHLENVVGADLDAHRAICGQERPVLEALLAVHRPLLNPLLASPECNPAAFPSCVAQLLALACLGKFDL